MRGYISVGLDFNAEFAGGFYFFYIRARLLEIRDTSASNLGATAHDLYMIPDGEYSGLGTHTEHLFLRGQS